MYSAGVNVVVVLLAISCVFGQSTSIPAKAPSQTIEEMWKAATAGDFLGKGGCYRYSAFFLHPAACDFTTFRVVSNHWGLYPAIAKGNDVEIWVACDDLGTINADLRYSPPPKITGNNIFVVVADYHMSLAPTRSTVIYVNGAKETKAEKPGPAAWQIADKPTSPFTTVNTAIRYVLEIQRSTKDPVIKKHAGETLTSLLALQ
jgi:hypothetical protein